MDERLTLLLVVMHQGQDGLAVLLEEPISPAAMLRASVLRDNQPGSYAAVKGPTGALARNPDGSIYDPVQETAGGGARTLSDRSRLVQQRADKAFGIKAAPPARLTQHLSWLEISLAAVVLCVMVGMMAAVGKP